jgi:hypothetical protein
MPGKLFYKFKFQKDPNGNVEFVTSIYKCCSFFALQINILAIASKKAKNINGRALAN